MNVVVKFWKAGMKTKRGPLLALPRRTADDYATRPPYISPPPPPCPLQASLLDDSPRAFEFFRSPASLCRAFISLSAISQPSLYPIMSDKEFGGKARKHALMPSELSRRPDLRAGPASVFLRNIADTVPGSDDLSLPKGTHISHITLPCHQLHSACVRGC